MFFNEYHVGLVSHYLNKINQPCKGVESNEPHRRMAGFKQLRGWNISFSLVYLSVEPPIAFIKSTNAVFCSLSNSNSIRAVSKFILAQLIDGFEVFR